MREPIHILGNMLRSSQAKRNSRAPVSAARRRDPFPIASLARSSSDSAAHSRKPFSLTSVTRCRYAPAANRSYNLPLASLRLHTAFAPIRRSALLCVSFHIGIAPAYAVNSMLPASCTASKRVHYVTQSKMCASLRQRMGQTLPFPLASRILSGSEFAPRIPDRLTSGLTLPASREASRKRRMTHIII